MKFVTVSELKLKATDIVRKLENDKEEVVITKNGKPVAYLKPFVNVRLELHETNKEKEEKDHGGKRTV